MPNAGNDTDRHGRPSDRGQGRAALSRSFAGVSSGGADIATAAGAGTEQLQTMLHWQSQRRHCRCRHAALVTAATVSGDFGSGAC